MPFLVRVVLVINWRITDTQIECRDSFISFNWEDNSDLERDDDFLNLSLNNSESIVLSTSPVRFSIPTSFLFFKITSCWCS